MNSFVSGLAPYIQGMIDMKHALGLPYDSSGRHLQDFDAMVGSYYPGQASLSRQMAVQWIVLRPGEHTNVLLRRITPIRQLGKYMNSVGAQAYLIPSGIPGKQIRYRPHLFSHVELRSLFDAADIIRTTPFGGQRQLLIPAMFRMIYCLGLRPGEARKLYRNDVDLNRGSVLIRESKGHKDRMLFMASDLLEYCREFDAAISVMHPDRIPFFPNQDGSSYNKSTPDCWFHDVLMAATPSIVASSASPARLYDLRHAHIVEVINRWARAGKNPESLVGYLSLHLGHTNTEDTWYYFHLAADFHPELRIMANARIESLIPEAHHEIR